MKHCAQTEPSFESALTQHRPTQSNDTANTYIKTATPICTYLHISHGKPKPTTEASWHPARASPLLFPTAPASRWVHRPKLLQVSFAVYYVRICGRGCVCALCYVELHLGVTGIRKMHVSATGNNVQNEWSKCKERQIGAQWTRRGCVCVLIWRCDSGPLSTPNFLFSDRNVFLISRIVLNCTGMLAAAMVSGSWSGIGEIHDCLPVSNSTALGPKNCQAETPQEPPQLHGVDEIHDALVFFPGSFDWEGHKREIALCPVPLHKAAHLRATTTHVYISIYLCIQIYIYVCTYSLYIYIHIYPAAQQEEKTWRCLFVSSIQLDRRRRTHVCQVARSA